MVLRPGLITIESHLWDYTDTSHGLQGWPLQVFFCQHNYFVINAIPIKFSANFILQFNVLILKKGTIITDFYHPGPNVPYGDKP